LTSRACFAVSGFGDRLRTPRADFFVAAFFFMPFPLPETHQKQYQIVSKDGAGLPLEKERQEDFPLATGSPTFAGIVGPVSAQAPDRPLPFQRMGPIGVRFGSFPNRMRDLSMCLRISMSRSFGGALVTQPRISRSAAAATSSTAVLKSASFAFEGLVAPLSLRTNCREEARISSDVAGGAKFASVRILRHMKEV